jgi:hypothetical protein
VGKLKMKERNKCDHPEQDETSIEFCDGGMYRRLKCQQCGDEITEYYDLVNRHNDTKGVEMDIPEKEQGIEPRRKAEEPYGHQIVIEGHDSDQMTALFEEIQNKYSFYDNCVMQEISKADTIIEEDRRAETGFLIIKNPPDTTGEANG